MHFGTTTPDVKERAHAGAKMNALNIVIMNL